MGVILDYLSTSFRLVVEDFLLARDQDHSDQSKVTGYLYCTDSILARKIQSLIVWKILDFMSKFFVHKVTRPHMLFLPSDICITVPNIRAPFRSDMISFSSSEDMRMQQIRGEITDLEGDIEHLYGYVDTLPGTQQLAARAALRKAFDVGRSISTLDRFPSTPPIEENESQLLGPNLKNHIIEMRKVYGDIADLRRTIEGIFGNASLNYLHSTMRKERKNNTGTSVTQFDIAA